MDIYNLKTGFNLLGIDCSIIDGKVLCIRLNKEYNSQREIELLNGLIRNYIEYKNITK